MTTKFNSREVEKFRNQNVTLQQSLEKSNADVQEQAKQVRHLETEKIQLQQQIEILKEELTAHRGKLENQKHGSCPRKEKIGASYEAV